MDYVFNIGRTRLYRFPTHANALVMDRSEATTSEVFVSIMEPGEAPPLHQHDDTEQVFYLLQGRGRLEVGGEPGHPDHRAFEVGPGDVVRIPPSTPHRVWCLGDQALKYLTVDCFVGGRPTAEPTWDSHVRVVCDQNGWDTEGIIANAHASAPAHASAGAHTFAGADTSAGAED